MTTHRHHDRTNEDFSGWNQVLAAPKRISQTWVIRSAGFVGQTMEGGPECVGSMLQSYDPDAHEGLGEAVWTNCPHCALRFVDPMAARQFYLQVSTVRPERYDGKPNRPLTAFSVMIEELK